MSMYPPITQWILAIETEHLRVRYHHSNWITINNNVIILTYCMEQQAVVAISQMIMIESIIS